MQDATPAARYPRRMPIVAAILGLLAFLAWASAAVHALLLLRHVAPPRSALSLAFQGWRFLDRSTFTESGHALHRRFVASFVAFFIVVVLAVPVAALSVP